MNDCSDENCVFFCFTWIMSISESFYKLNQIQQKQGLKLGNIGKFKEILYVKYLYYLLKNSMKHENENKYKIFGTFQKVNYIFVFLQENYFK